MEKNLKELIYIKDEEIDISSVIRTLIRQKKIIILFTLAATISSIIYTFRVKPTWIGSFNIVVQNKDSSFNENLSGTIAQITGEDFSGSNKNETERLILLSPSVLMPVYEKVNNHYKENNLKTFSSFKSWKNKELEVPFNEVLVNVTVNSAGSAEKSAAIGAYPFLINLWYHFRSGVEASLKRINISFSDIESI